MKFRIEPNTVKFRLTQHEIEQLKSDQMLTDAISINPESRFEYSIKPSKDVSKLTIDFTDRGAMAIVPVNLLHDWFGSDQIGIKEVLVNNKGEKLDIVIEEDLPPRKLKKKLA